MLEIQMVLNPFITLFPNLGTRSFGTGSSQTLYEKKKMKSLMHYPSGFIKEPRNSKGFNNSFIICFSIRFESDHDSSLHCSALLKLRFNKSQIIGYYFISWSSFGSCKQGDYNDWWVVPVHFSWVIAHIKSTHDWCSVNCFFLLSFLFKQYNSNLIITSVTLLQIYRNCQT